MSLRMLMLHTPNPDEWLSDGVAYPKLPWLGSELLPKLARWATESRSSEFKSTLSLIPVQKYSLRYQQLKDKYKEMVKVREGRWRRLLSIYSNSQRQTRAVPSCIMWCHVY